MMKWKNERISYVIAIIAILVVVVICCMGIIEERKYKILIVGDSIGNGEGCVDYANKWFKYIPPYLEEEYGVKAEITNISMGGNTSYAGFVRTAQLKEKDRYDLVIVCYGQNDATEEFSLYYEVLLREIIYWNPSCEMISILESAQQEYTEKMRVIQELAEHYKVYVADTIGAFEKSGRDYGELCTDGTHPNDEGQKLYFEEIRKIIDSIFSHPPVERKHVDAVNVKVRDFEHYDYYLKSDFDKIDDLTYELVVDNGGGRLGIDYWMIKGEHCFSIYIDEQWMCDKQIVWDMENSQRYIEVIADESSIDEKIQIQFSDVETAEAFEGIVITSSGER